MSLRDLPPVARSMAAASAAVTAALAADPDELRTAAADLAAFDPSLTGPLLGDVLRMLLEESHPDGLDADDLRSVLETTTKAALAWLPEADPEVLLVILAGALGVHPEEADGIARPPARAVALHAPLLIAGLLPVTRRGLEFYLEAAFREMARSQTMEAP
ncbi:hypothetical protein [Hamadaea sp.]|uniref:hypothetical protein n=1 Tax=Hamadaea sp. TaxID=2024425 RepID=UPI0025C395BE|nr:hypothetical protein [Hamadaea sp.]